MENRKGILGRKIGMTQVFATNGKLVPVTVLKIEPNIVMQVKTVLKDGYDAIQLGVESKRQKVSNKPEIGRAKKANTEPKRFIKEIREANVSEYTIGDKLSVDLFTEGEIVDVTGVSKGKGFQGVIKRHNQSRGPMGHGSQYHRGVGSMGTLRPMRVFKGKKLPGHMGNVTVTMQNLEIVSIDKENNIILIKGNVPGPNKSFVIIKSAVKNPNTKRSVHELVSYEEAKVEETKEETATEVSE